MSQDNTANSVALAQQSITTPMQSADHSMRPKSFPEWMHLCTMISRSGMAPKGLENPGAIFVCIEMGHRLGFSYFESLQNIAVINGKPCLYGDKPLAYVRASGQLEYIHEMIEGTLPHDEATAICRVKRIGEGEVVSRFSVADAKAAKLWQKKGKDGRDTPWVTYPKRMLMFKARTYALRDVFPDVLAGVAFGEEQEEIRDAKTGAPSHKPQGRVIDEVVPQKHDDQEHQDALLQDMLGAIDAARTLQELDALAAAGQQLEATRAQTARTAFQHKRKDLRTQNGPAGYASKAQRIMAEQQQTAQPPAPESEDDKEGALPFK